MLRTNSRKAKENIRAYIMDSWNIEPEEAGRTWEETREDVKQEFVRCAYSSDYEKHQNRQQAFKNWLCGLPRCLGDFVLAQGVEVLGAILEETPEQDSKYTEDQAEELLSYLIFREVIC